MEKSVTGADYSEIWVPALDLGANAAALVVLLPAAAVVGYALGARSRRRALARGVEIVPGTGEITLGAILGLLGLLLAFSFGHALNLAETRKTLLIEEAAAIGTAFNRADLVPDPGRTELQAVLIDYARSRITDKGVALDTVENVQAFLRRTLELQARLWPLTMQAIADPVSPPVKVFVAGAVNDVLDAHLRRMRTVGLPVSRLSQATVLAAGLTALFLLGYRTGLVGRLLSWRAFVFAGFLVFVMVAIIDMQRSREGTVRLDEGPLLATIREMEQAMRNSGRD